MTTFLVINAQDLPAKERFYFPEPVIGEHQTQQIPQPISGIDWLSLNPTIWSVLVHDTPFSARTPIN
jgi:hypothetical protein